MSFTDEVLNNEAKKKWNKSVPIWKKMDMEMRHLQNLKTNRNHRRRLMAQVDTRERVA